MTSKEIISEIKKQIWDNAYHVKEHHWTQIYSNLDLLSKDLEILEIIKKLFNEENGVVWLQEERFENYTSYRIEDYDAWKFLKLNEDEYKLIKEWLDEE